MTPLAEVRILLVTAGAGWAAARVDALRAAGAGVRATGPAQDLLLALAESAPHLVVIADLAGELAAPAVIRAIRTQGARGRELPVLALVDEDDRETLSALLAGGQATLCAAGAPVETLLRAVAAEAAPALRAAETEARLRAVEDEARARRRQLEEARRHLEVLEHDLRTPLEIIAGFASNLRDEIDGPMTAGQREAAERIVKAALRLGALLDQTAELAQPAAEPELAAPREREPQRRQLDVAALAAEIVALFRDEARRRNVRLELAGAACLMLWGDATRLGQALTNLIGNAMKFTPPGGRIEVVVRLHTPAAGEGDAQRRRAEIVVSDSGPGIPPEARERVLERGFRLPRDGALPGRGIGLSVCREVAKLHGGDIVIGAAAAGGASVTLELPLDLRARAASGILLVRAGDGVEDPIVDALCSEAEAGLAAITPAQLERFLPAAAACDALVIVPRGARSSALELALRRIRGGDGRRSAEVAAVPAAGTARR